MPGDDIIGFITRGFGVSIHKRDCPTAIQGTSSEESRASWVEAHWEHDFVGANDNSVYEALIQIYA